MFLFPVCLLCTTASFNYWYVLEFKQDWLAHYLPSPGYIVTFKVD